MSCNHDKIICACCGEEINPAQLLAKRKRVRSPEAQEQCRLAARQPRKKKEKPG